MDHKKQNFPPKPSPPLNRLLKEGIGHRICPECGSSMMKTKFFFFGKSKSKCIHPDCGKEI